MQHPAECVVVQLYRAPKFATLRQNDTKALHKEAWQGANLVGLLEHRVQPIDMCAKSEETQPGARDLVTGSRVSITHSDHLHMLARRAKD